MALTRIRDRGMRARAALYGARGMTLVEILLVLAILALAMGIGVYMMMGVLTRGYLRDEAMRMTSTIQFTYNQAGLNNTPYRLVIDLEEQSYHTEMTDSRVVIRQAAEEYDEGLLPEEARELEEQRRFQRSDFFREEEDDFFGVSRRVGYQRAEEAELRPRTLRSGIEFYSVRTSNQPRPVTRGRVAINFFPNGFQQQAMIVLWDRETEEKFTLVTEPLTGRVRIYSGEIDVPEDFGREARHGR